MYFDALSYRSQHPGHFWQQPVKAVTDADTIDALFHVMYLFMVSKPCMELSTRNGLCFPNDHWVQLVNWGHLLTQRLMVSADPQIRLFAQDLAVADVFGKRRIVASRCFVGLMIQSGSVKAQEIMPWLIIGFSEQAGVLTGKTLVPLLVMPDLSLRQATFACFDFSGVIATEYPPFYRLVDVLFGLIDPAMDQNYACDVVRLVQQALALMMLPRSAEQSGSVSTVPELLNIAITQTMLVGQLPFTWRYRKIDTYAALVSLSSRETPFVVGLSFYQALLNRYDKPFDSAVSRCFWNLLNSPVTGNAANDAGSGVIRDRLQPLVNLTDACESLQFALEAAGDDPDNASNSSLSTTTSATSADPSALSDNIVLVNLDQTPGSLNPYLFRKAVLALNSSLQQQHSADVDQEVLNLLSGYCLHWLFLVSPEDTLSLLKSWGLEKPLKMFNQSLKGVNAS